MINPMTYVFRKDKRTRPYEDNTQITEISKKQITDWDHLSPRKQAGIFL